MIVNLFPIIIIVLYFISAIICLFHKEWNLTIYWAGAGIINLTVILR